MLELGTPRLGVLVKLNASARNWTRIPSRTVNCLNSERSVLKSPGPSMMFIPELPNRYAAGMAKALTSNQRCNVRCPAGRLPSPIRSGLCAWIVRLPLLFAAVVGLTGNPDLAVMIVLKAQPPRRASVQCLVVIQCRPAPNGNSYVMLWTKYFATFWGASPREPFRFVGSSRNEYGVSI